MPGFSFDYLREWRLHNFPWKPGVVFNHLRFPQVLPGISLFALEHELCKCSCRFSWDLVLKWHRGPSLFLDGWYPFCPHLLSTKSTLCILGQLGNEQHWILLQYMSYTSVIVIYMCDTCMIFDLFLSSCRDFTWRTHISGFCLVTFYFPTCCLFFCVINNLGLFSKRLFMNHNGSNI